LSLAGALSLGFSDHVTLLFVRLIVFIGVSPPARQL
jgi:hypothetical protein